VRINWESDHLISYSEPGKAWYMGKGMTNFKPIQGEHRPNSVWGRILYPMKGNHLL